MMNKEVMFENKGDKDRQTKAIFEFCFEMGVMFQPCERRNDKYPKCDFKLLNKESGVHIGYAEVKGVKRNYDPNGNVLLAIRKLKGLQDLELKESRKTIVIYAFEDCVKYIPIKNIKGYVKWFERTHKRPNHIFDDELVVEIKQKNLLSIKK